MIIQSIDQAIGNTPLFTFTHNTNEIYIKLEKMNPAQSIKDRAVLYMLKKAMEDGIIQKDTILIEATSGNTGIALAMLASAYKIPVEIVMPESMSIERRQLIKAYGATLVLTPANQGMQGAIDYMNRKLKEKTHYLSLQQFQNPANIQAHYETTAQEILKDIIPDIVIAGIGTGGTIMGLAKGIKEINPHVTIIGIEPAASPLLTKGKSGKHQIQGIGANFIPDILDPSMLDEVLPIADNDAIQMSHDFAKETGILVGISSGANIYGALQVSKHVQNKKIVTIAPDGFEKYLTDSAL